MEIVKWLESVRDDSFGSADFSRTQRILTADFSRTVKEDLHVRWIRNYENHKCIAHAKCGFLTSALLPSFLWHPSRSRSRGDYIPPSPDIHGAAHSSSNTRLCLEEWMQQSVVRADTLGRVHM
jgi:hypothetical protein